VGLFGNSGSEATGEEDGFHGARVWSMCSWFN
jgi:hypothetical protein